MKDERQISHPGIHDTKSRHINGKGKGDRKEEDKALYGGENKARDMLYMLRWYTFHLFTPFLPPFLAVLKLSLE